MLRDVSTYIDDGDEGLSEADVVAFEEFMKRGNRSGDRKRPLTETERAIANTIFEHSMQGTPIYSRQLLDESGTSEEEREAIKQVIFLLKSTTALNVMAAKKKHPDMSSRGAVQGVYQILPSDDEESAGEDSQVERFAGPIVEIPEEHREYLIQQLKRAVDGTRKNQTIFALILKGLQAATETGVSVTYQHLTHEVFEKTNKPNLHVADRALEQALLYLGFEGKARLERYNIVIHWDEDRIQASVLDEGPMQEELQAPTRVNTRKGTEESNTIKDKLFLGVQHLSHGLQNFSPQHIIDIVFSNGPVSVKEIQKRLADMGLSINYSNIWRLINNVRELNDVAEYSPLGFDVYGDERYKIGLSKKPYLPTLGVYTSNETHPNSSMYPMQVRNDFNIAAFESIMDKSCSSFYYGGTKVAEGLKLIAAYSRFHFSISSSVFAERLMLQYPGMTHQQGVCLFNKVKEKRDMLKVHGINLNDASGGVVISMPNCGDDMYSPTWAEYHEMVVSDSGTYPEDFLKIWQQESAKNMKDNVPESARRRLERMAVSNGFSLTGNYVHSPWIPASERLPEESLDKISMLARNLEVKGVKHRRSLPPNITSMLAVLLDQTFKGKTLNRKDFSELMTGEEPLSANTSNSFSVFITRLNADDRWPFCIKSVSSSNQAHFYYVAMKEGVDLAA